MSANIIYYLFRITFCIFFIKKSIAYKENLSINSCLVQNNFIFLTKLKSLTKQDIKIHPSFLLILEEPISNNSIKKS